MPDEANKSIVVAPDVAIEMLSALRKVGTDGDFIVGGVAHLSTTNESSQIRFRGFNTETTELIPAYTGLGDRRAIILGARVPEHLGTVELDICCTSLSCEIRMRALMEAQIFAKHRVEATLLTAIEKRLGLSQ